MEKTMHEAVDNKPSWNKTPRVREPTKQISSDRNRPIIGQVGNLPKPGNRPWNLPKTGNRPFWFYQQLPIRAALHVCNSTSAWTHFDIYIVLSYGAEVKNFQTPWKRGENVVYCQRLRWRIRSYAYKVPLTPCTSLWCANMHKPRRFFCSNQRTSNLKFVTGIYFQTFTVRLSPCNFTHIYLYFLEKLTFAMFSLPHMWQWFKKIFCHWHFRRSSSVVWKFLFPRDMISYTIKNRTAFFWLQCGFLIFIRFSK